jgi:hypothetical protein
MAIDPRISLAVQQASVAPAIDLFNRVKQQRIQNQALPGQMLAQELSNRLREQQIARGGIDLENAENQRDIASLAQFSILNKEALQQANDGDSTALQQALQARIQQLGPERSQQSQEALQMIQSGQGQQAANLLGNSVNLAARSGLLNQSQLTAGQRELSQKTEILKGVEFDQSGNVINPENLTTEQRLVLMQEGFTPRRTGSSAITAATTPGLTKQVAESEATIAGAKEGATLDVKSKKLPAIESAIQKAKDLAKQEGIAFTDLNRSKAALPSLEKTIGELKTLAPIATSTLAGRGFDALAKELGFGATKGSTAKVKFTSLIQNQILPLLKPTFGGNTSDNELNQLKLTLADPNDAPENKIAALDAFLSQQKLKIESQEREIQGLQGANTQTIGRFTVEVID